MQEHQQYCHESFHAHSGHQGGCCHQAGPGHRRFYSHEEKTEHLKQYLEQLKAETKGVEERLEKLSRDKAEPSD